MWRWLTLINENAITTLWKIKLVVNPAWFLTYFPTMDNGFDYPNDFFVQNALWGRLDTIEILQIRLDYFKHLLEKP